MQFAPIENAIRAWVKTATGFADALIYFADQSGPQPVTNPFITIKIGGGIRSLGAYDEFTTSTNLANPPGTEITQLISGQRDLLVTVTIWGENTVTYAPSAPGSLPGTGGLTAVEVATKISKGARSSRSACTRLTSSLKRTPTLKRFREQVRWSRMGSPIAPRPLTSSGHDVSLVIGT